MEAGARSDASAVLDFHVAQRALRQGVLCQGSRRLPEWQEKLAESILGLDLHCKKPSGVSSFIAIDTSRLHGNLQLQISRLIRIIKPVFTGMVALSPRRF